MGDTMREAFERAMIERHEWHPVMFARKTLPGCEDEYSNPHTEYAWQGAQIGRQFGMEQARVELAKTSEAADCWAILTPNGSKLVSEAEAKGRAQAYPMFKHPAAGC